MPRTAPAACRFAMARWSGQVAAILKFAEIAWRIPLEETEFNSLRPDMSKNLMRDSNRKMLALAPRVPIPARPLRRDPARRPMLMRTGQYKRRKPKGLTSGKARPPGDQRTRRLTQEVARPRDAAERRFLEP